MPLEARVSLTRVEKYAQAGMCGSIPMLSKTLLAITSVVLHRHS